MGGELLEGASRAAEQRGQHDGDVVIAADGFERWSAAISDGLRPLHTAGHLATAISPDDIAVTLLAALQGGLLLAQVQRDARPLETAVDTILALATRK